MHPQTAPALQLPFFGRLFSGAKNLAKKAAAAIGRVAKATAPSSGER
jgi:hypothetical protein